jgi:hypothetical protein
MEPPIYPTDIDSPFVRRVIYSHYLRLRKCELIAGKWYVQLAGFHDKFCMDWHGEPPFENGEMVKITIEKVVQDGRETV